MDGVRTRGARRGVRTRGGRGGGRGGGSGGGSGGDAVAGGSAQLVVVEEGRGRGRGRGRSSRRALFDNQASRRPLAIDEMHLVEVTALPATVRLESPLHPKRRRNWSPCPSGSGSSATPAQPPSMPASPMPASPMSASPMPASPMAMCEPPSPGMFVELGGSAPSTPQSTPSQRPRPRQALGDDEIFFHINYGSEPESGESDDEEGVAPTIPRVLRMAMDTPEDDDDPSADSQHPTVAPSYDADLPGAETAYEPNDFYDFKWISFPTSPIPPESRRETFSNINVGPTTPCVDPYDIFIAIWDRQFMEYIASETNHYAQESAQRMMDDHNLYPKSRISKWQDTCANELYVYFAVLLAMGVVVKSRIEEYWSATPDIFCTLGFSAHMSGRRFQILSKCIHFNRNSGMCAQELSRSEAKLYKIMPVMSHLNAKFQAMYNLGQNLSIDESLLQWKGWLDINQFIPNKAASVGIKTYELCESQTGYLWRFEVHAHKRGLPQPAATPLDGFTPTIVLRLIQGLEYKGHTLCMDNYYNSPALARKLKTLGFDCVGTLRTNRQFVPQALSSLTKSNMRRGQTTGFTSGDVDLMVWRDQNRVATISTYHGNSAVTEGPITKPSVVFDYNVMMGGVDKKDQMLAMYPIERKRTRVWYKKLFRRLLNVSVLNSFILAKESSSSSSLTHRAFRISLIKSLLDKHSPSVAPTPALPQRSNSLARIHHLAEYPFLPHSRERLRRPCFDCKKRVHIYCVGCNKPLCMNCFPSFHT